MSQLAGKIGIVFGVANKRSIAWAIAQAWHKAGAKLALARAENVKKYLTASKGIDATRIDAHAFRRRYGEAPLPLSTTACKRKLQI